MLAEVSLLAAPQSAAAGTIAQAWSTFFQMLWAVRCPKIQHLRCQERQEPPGMPGSGGGKMIAWELQLIATSHFWHLISCMTLNRLLGLSEPCYRMTWELHAVIVSGTWHMTELGGYWFPLPWWLWAHEITIIAIIIIPANMWRLTIWCDTIGRHHGPHFTDKEN